MLGSSARNRLLSIAEGAVRAAALDTPLPSEEPDDPECRRLAGAFVTLRRRGRLRGCIGTIPAARPIWETVRDMAVAAARRDPRFDPVEADEVDDLTIEVSVLTPMRPVEDPAEVEVGRDGLYVVQGARSGLLLPQVPVEQGWDRETFLGQTCLKAGLPQDAWRESGTEIFAFRAQVF